MNETNLNNPEHKELKKEPKIKLFGDIIDNEMCEYAILVKNFNYTKYNKDNYENLKSYQETIKDIDVQRKYQHDKITKIWLESDFYNGTYNNLQETDLKTYSHDEDDKEKRFLKARKMVNELAESVYIKILDSMQDNQIKNNSYIRKDTSKDMEALRKQGFLKYHTLEDIKPETNIPLNTNIIFTPELDRAIKRYIDSNNSFLRIITRYEPGSEKSKQFIKNADENKTNFHRDIIRALVTSGFIPSIDEQKWLYDEWNNKEKNELRQIAEKLSEYYAMIANKTG